jgi:hypothetical protein
MKDSSVVRDAFETALSMSRSVDRDGAGIVGYGVCELFDGDGRLILARPFANLITDYGDLYYATMAIALVSPSNTAQPTKATGMQIGSGATTATKAGAGSALGALLAGQAFDATYPNTNPLATGLGVEAVYKTTYAAGTGTGAVAEASITNGAIGTGSLTGNTIARILTGTITKASTDSLAITWRHKFLGS